MAERRRLSLQKSYNTSIKVNTQSERSGYFPCPIIQRRNAEINGEVSRYTRAYFGLIIMESRAAQMFELDASEQTDFRAELTVFGPVGISRWDSFPSIYLFR